MNRHKNKNQKYQSGQSDRKSHMKLSIVRKLEKQDIHRRIIEKLSRQNKTKYRRQESRQNTNTRNRHIFAENNNSNPV